MFQPARTTPRTAASPAPLAVLLAAILASATSAPLRAEAPELAPGECLYLLGAPPGAPEATEEERVTEAALGEECVNEDAGAAVDLAGPNHLHLWADQETFRRSASCTGQAAASHEFFVASGLTRVPATVDVAGELRGRMGILPIILAGSTQPALVWIEVRLEEVDPLTGAATLLASRRIFEDRRVGSQLLAEVFRVRLSAELTPGRTHRVGLRGFFSQDGVINPVDFGRPGSDTFIRYERIEVCLLEPLADRLADRFDSLDDRLAELEARLLADADDRMEWELLNKDCRPGLWLPQERGGRLEEARALVAGRIGAAEGDRGVNSRVARQRLEEADALAEDGWHQKACQRLSDALRALTTP